MDGGLTQLTPGQVLAHDFKIVRALAAGGMGSVYLVEQISTGRQRALKIMHPEYARDEESRVRFTQEARAGARIRSEHVVEVVSAGVDDETGIPWLAMELLDGEELSARMQRLGRLPPSDVLEIFRQLCHGLGEAHRAGLIHRDLKPENIFVANSRRQNVPFTVKILDFGVAKLALESATQMDGTRPVGTPRWMAPEQSEHNGHVTAATDVWALGLIAFYLLTGRYYWRSANARDGKLTTLLRELVIEPIEFASKRAAFFTCAGAIPSGFDAWFARCVVREPEQRFVNAEVALEELAPILENATPWDGPLPDLPYGSAPTGQRPGHATSGEGATMPPMGQATPAEGLTMQRPRTATGAVAAPGTKTSGAGEATVLPIPPSTGAAGGPARQGQTGASPRGATAGPPLAAPGSSTAPEAQAALAAAAAPQRSSPPVLAIVLGAAVLIGLVLFTQTRGRPTPAVAPAVAPAVSPKAAPAPAADPGRQLPHEQESFMLLLESLPSGAEVREGDHVLGTTPLQLMVNNAEVRKQPRSFRLEKAGFKPYSVLQGPSPEAVRMTATLGEDDAPKPAKAPAPKEHPKKPADEPELRLRR